jgi:hypothetical protein
LIDAVPPDGAVNVPIDASLHARYALSAAYLEEDVIFRKIGGEDRVLPAQFNTNEGLLSVTPPEPLEPDATYEVVWPRLRGVGTASLGRGRTVSFTAGAAPDRELPRFSGLQSIDWRVDREHDDCTESLEERFVFEVEPGDASDDGGRESLLLRVFQTRGANVDLTAAPSLVLMRPLPASGETVSVTRTFSDGLGEVCFAAQTSDLTGKVSGGAERNVCVETVEPPYFEGCRVVAPSGRRSSAPGLLVLFALVALRYARRC